MGTLRKWLFDLADGTALTALNVKDTTGTLSANQVAASGGSAATSSNEHPYPGVTSGKFSAVSGQQCLARLVTDTGDASLAFSVGFWYSGTPPTTAALNFFNGRGTAPNMKLAISTAGKLLLQDAVGGAAWSPSFALSAGYYRADCYVTWGAGSTGTAGMQYCLDDTNTAVESGTATAKNFGANDFIAADVGVIGSTATNRIVYITSVQMEEGRTSFIGPLVTAVPSIPVSAVIDATGWSPVGGTTILANISDDDAATGAVSGVRPVGQVLRLGLPGLDRTSPASGDLVVPLAGYRGGGATVTTIVGYLYEGGTLRATSETVSGLDVTNTSATMTFLAANLTGISHAAWVAGMELRIAVSAS